MNIIRTTDFSDPALDAGFKLTRRMLCAMYHRELPSVEKICNVARGGRVCAGVKTVRF